MTTDEKLITAEELFCLSDSGCRRELLDGKVVEMTPPGGQHGWVLIKAGRLLANFVAERDLGDVLGGDTGVLLARNPDRVRGPDVCFYAKGRLPGGVPRSYLEVIPDLVIEIVSPGDRAGEVRQKTNEWLAAGVRLVITLYPETRTAVIETPERMQVLQSGDTLSCDPVVPGFSVPVSALFP